MIMAAAAVQTQQTVTMEQPAPQRKKRARPSTSPDGEGGKRGRPRVDKQDESAADRRRTQIRMAQRAYRQRKESTLEELRKRVSELTKTIEVMNTTFNTCSDRLYASNLTQDQMLDINEVSTLFEKLVGEARNPTELDSSEGEDGRTARTPRQNSTANTNAAKPKNVPSWLDESTLTHTNNAAAGDTGNVGMGYVMYMPQDDQTHSSEPEDINNMLQQIQQPLPAQVSEALEQEDFFNVFEIGGNTFPMAHNPRPPMTYSFQESTFARRLHRACAEAAYQLLLDPRRRPTEFQRIFRLSLLGRDRQKITTQLKAILARGPHEDLDFYEAPHIHVGGAGTHYSRRDAYGNLMPKKKTFNVGRVGPQTLSTLEKTARGNITMDMIVELAGFEGEWFDPYDVQGYLEEKGIYIDPTSSFAEAQIVEWPTPRSEATSEPSDHGAATPPGQFAVPEKSTPLTTSQVNIMINEADVDFSKWDDSRNLELTNVGYSDAEFGSWMNFLQPGESVRHYNEQQAQWEGMHVDTIRAISAPSTHPPSPVPTRKSVLIDVSKLVKGKPLRLSSWFA
jgi:hypothetical protein